MTRNDTDDILLPSSSPNPFYGDDGTLDIIKREYAMNEDQSERVVVLFLSF